MIRNFLHRFDYFLKNVQEVTVLYLITLLIISDSPLFFYFTMRHYIPKWAWVAWLWAFSIAYAQVYVGIHYPLDVIGGAVLGVLFGSFMAMFFNRKFGFANFDTQPTGTL